MKRGKKTLPYALVLSMAFSMVPAPVYASENDIMIYLYNYMILMLMGYFMSMH